jgi:hypothetical protein
MEILVSYIENGLNLMNERKLIFDYEHIQFRIF